MSESTAVDLTVRVIFDREIEIKDEIELNTLMEELSISIKHPFYKISHVEANRIGVLPLTKNK